MKLTYLAANGFRGFQVPIRVEFAPTTTIIDGRNGVGKSTIFDAVEFALTGNITKYGEAKSQRETVADYIWNRDAATPLDGRYVEIGFSDSQGPLVLRRTPLGVPDPEDLETIARRMCDMVTAPSASVSQLCTTSIIRDEQITALSLDLGETERYVLLRDALGASDAERWISRGSSLVSLAKLRSSDAEKEVSTATSDLSAATRRLDEIRAAVLDEAVIGQSVQMLQRLIGSISAPDMLIGPARQYIAQQRAHVSALQLLQDEMPENLAIRNKLDELRVAVDRAAEHRANSMLSLEQTPNVVFSDMRPNHEALSKDLKELLRLGEHLGLHEGNCPLCASPRSKTEFEKGMAALRYRIASLEDEGTLLNQQRERRLEAELALAEADRALSESREALETAQQKLHDFDERVAAYQLPADIGAEAVNSQLNSFLRTLEDAQANLRIVETIRFNGQLDAAKQREDAARRRLEKAQERFGRARKGLAAAVALHNAARRAASETLDTRLERVLPLMSELYKRLRPHPEWDDIQYAIRGDVRRFLKLQVGDTLNPQFMFSSGQRRATGLAFLLSVNLSIAWSKWNSILLDDPVQHIDDFRSVHLAEVLAQLVSEGRQVICAVEDSALADMLGRRLPIRSANSARRVTLGRDHAGYLVVKESRLLSPLVPAALILNPPRAVS